MFCPQCGARQSDELRYCKTCGVNLHAVRRAVLAGGPGEKPNQSHAWVGEVALYEAESKRLAAEFERESGLSPELKRYHEIKAGVITSCVGIGVAIFFYIISEGIIRSGQNPPGDAEILSRIWVAGVIPFLIGLGIIINGLFVSKKIVEAERRERQLRPAAPETMPATTEPLGLRSGDTNEIIPTGFSVTEGTTKHLKTPAHKGETRSTGGE